MFSKRCTGPARFAVTDPHRRVCRAGTGLRRPGAGGVAALEWTPGSYGAGDLDIVDIAFKIKPALLLEEIEQELSTIKTELRGVARNAPET